MVLNSIITLFNQSFKSFLRKMKKTIGEKWHEIIRMERLKKEETARKGKYEEIKIEKDHF